MQGVFCQHAGIRLDRWILRKGISMQVFITLFALAFVGSVAWVAFQVVDGFRNKALAVLGGFVGIALVVSILPSAVEKPDYRVSSPPPPTSREAPSKTVTLKNYKEKGDSVNLVCSGTTGNITCKSKN